jgi:16S rRNA (cytidine1402-2'-O)-methyltransferase
LNKIKQIKEIDDEILCLAFESPNRIQETVKIIGEILPDADLVIARELTKKFEEIIRGKTSEILPREYKGEITLVIS